MKKSEFRAKVKIVFLLTKFEAGIDKIKSNTIEDNSSDELSFSFSYSISCGFMGAKSSFSLVIEVDRRISLESEEQELF